MMLVEVVRVPRARALDPQILLTEVGWGQGFGFDDLILICLVMSVSSVVMGGGPM